MKLIIAVAWGGLAVYVAVLLIRPRWFDRPLFEVLLNAGLGGHARALLVRLPHIAALIVFQFSALHAFGVDVPLVYALATLPVVSWSRCCRSRSRVSAPRRRQWSSSSHASRTARRPCRKRR